MENSEQIIPATGSRVEWGAVIPFDGLEDLPADCNAAIRAGVEYWRSICPESGLPGPQNIDLTEIPRLHQYVRLVDVVGDPPRFRIRQTGAHVAYFLGPAQPGEWFEDFFPKFVGSGTQLAFLEVIQSRQSNWRRGTCELAGGKGFTPVERVQLPISIDGENVDMIMIFCIFGVSILKLD